MKSLGICCGASTITMVSYEKNGKEARVLDVVSKAHEGNPKQVVADLLGRMNVGAYDAVAVTGRRFRQLMNLTSISEPEAVECALSYINRKGKTFSAVVSAGGETFMVYRLNAQGRIDTVFTGNKCASGTGEFFLQQIRRMDVGLDDAIRYAQSEEPYHVSGRCSVFCKSDCTHATNKGVPKGQVVAGLCKMMAGKVLELLKNVPKENILLVGGTTRNRVMTDYLRREIRGLTIPKEATYFEALGAAVWACEHPTSRLDDLSRLFTHHMSQFEYHRPLSEFADRVTFASMDRGVAADGDVCIVGLDVGSTTTKIVLLRERDLKIIASEYLRTNGDPVGAARRCYRAVLDQLGDTKVSVRGLGVTGSGRKIAGLHALTDGVINEIIAHATAAIHFDPEVDTIFEIGGQDAKYTYITNGVASDYAMNEACSAGTGSFLEESAKETLGIDVTEIADWAMRGKRPPNFNDQCAAFIASDIKNASHEGVPKEDIVAGLVYSICMNYVNRVKGSRPVGRKVFMQGGVCYNRAVPIAMAALSGKSIVVPPEPGLMGAYGVALEVKNRLDHGLMREQEFDLRALADREVRYREPFVCGGGKEGCDRGCTISRIEIEGKVYPFGGACNRYYNIRQHIQVDPSEHDLVVLRQRLVYDTFAAKGEDLPPDAKTVGINRSFLTHTYYPLFSTFFVELGLRPVLAEEVVPEGVDARTAPFCFPCELSHGYFKDLLGRKTDYLFLPHLHGVEVENGYSPSKLCPLVQGESFVLRSTFEREIGDRSRILDPFLQFNKGREHVREQFADLAKRLGFGRKRGLAAFDTAWSVYEAMRAEMLRLGREALRQLEAHPDRFGVVLCGRPYNAFASEANKGIPHKFASRGITVIPVDFLDLSTVPAYDHMYWSMGQIILKGAEIIRDHPQLFGAYITNFSCGPDSFVVGYFRDRMGRKPSLTLELDNHTADAGLETRVEAFLDIVARYRQLRLSAAAGDGAPPFRPAASRIEGKRFLITTSSGEEVDMFDPRVRVVFPSMSDWGSKGVAAAMRYAGVRAIALSPMNEEDLRLGRGNTMCKECLPLILTTGALLRYLRDERPKGEITVYFMPTAEGPCRFGQYEVFMRNLIRHQRIPDVAFMSLTCDDNYGGLGNDFVILGWYAALVADSFQAIHNAMLANAKDPEAATRRLREVYDEVLASFSGGWKGLRKALKIAAAEIRQIPKKRPMAELPTVLIVGEIYVRQEGLARRWLPEILAKHGIFGYVAPIHEWMYYIDYEVEHGLNDRPASLAERLANKAKHKVMVQMEKDVKNTLAESGWFVPRLVDMDHLVGAGGQFINPNLTGEAILTVGGPMAEVGSEFCGAIAIGPFGCMPNRLSESILSLNLDREHLLRFRREKILDRVTRDIPTLPFLAIESDGGPFPQVIEARLETFILQSLRVHEAIMRARKG